MIEIMQSIRPEWIQKIIDGEKTVEIRKTRPISEPPYRVYMYCTKPRWPYEDALAVGCDIGEAACIIGGGKVVGEYVCDEVAKIDIDSVGPFLMHDDEPYYPPEIGWKTGMQEARRELIEYAGVFTKLYGWHITSRKVYDKPIDLAQYKHYEAKGRGFFVPLERAPQSWCYVEGPNE